MAFPNTTFVARVTNIASVWLQAVNDFINGFPAWVQNIPTPVGQTGKLLTSDGTNYTLVTYTPSTGASGADIVATPAAYPTIDPTGATVSNFTQFVSDCAGKRGFIPAGQYKIDVSTASAFKPNVTRGAYIYGSGWTSDGTSGTVFNVTGGYNFFEAINTSGVNADSQIVLEGVYVNMDAGPATAGATVPTFTGQFGSVSGREAGCGVFNYNCSNLHIKGCWFGNARNNGYYGENAYGCTIDNNSFFIHSRKTGIRFFSRANAVHIKGAKSYGSGRIFAGNDFANIEFNYGGAGLENLGVSVGEATDYSAAGQNAFNVLSIGNTTPSQEILSVVISGTPGSQSGVINLNAAVTNPMSVGFKFGFLYAQTQPDLSCPYPFIVTAVGTSTINFAVSSYVSITNGTYTSATENGLTMRPYVHGLSMVGVQSATVTGTYCEGCSGTAAYFGSGTTGVDYRGNWVTQKAVSVDTATGVNISSNTFVGISAGVRVSTEVGTTIEASNIYKNGAYTTVILATGATFRQDAVNNDTLVNGFITGRGRGNDSTNYVSGPGLGQSLQPNGGTGAGQHNVLIGPEAAPNLSTGYNVTILGRRAGLSATSAYNVSFYGSRAGDTITSASGSNFFGFAAGSGETTGVGLNFVGVTAGLNSSGSLNSNFQGTSAGAQPSLTTWSYATGVGNNALNASSYTTNVTGLGSNAQVGGNNQVQLGDSATTTYVYGTVQNRSDERDKAAIRTTILGRDFIRALGAEAAIDWKWDYREDYYEEVDASITQEIDVVVTEPHSVLANLEVPVLEKDPNNPGKMRPKMKKELATIPYSHRVLKEKDGSKVRKRYHHGFSAQQVKAICDRIGVDFGGLQHWAIAGGDDKWSLGYEEFIGPLARAFYEQDEDLKALRQEVEDLKALIKAS